LDCALQKTIIGMHVQMNEIFALILRIHNFSNFSSGR
jgi:hypothetical protein